MDQFTATAQPVTAPVDPITPTSKPHPAFRKLFLFLLLAVFISAGATAYILMSGTPTVVPTPQPLQTNQENPFNETVTTEINPFAEAETDNEETVAVNPFADETSGTNPFDQFDTDSTEVTSETYENPF